MSKNIKNIYAFIKYLNDNKLISDFDSFSNFLFIVKVSADGFFFETWDARVNPAINAFDTLEENIGYQIISKDGSTPYELYGDPDKFICNEIITKVYTFTEFLGKNISLDNFKDKILFIVKVSNNGSFVTWDSRASSALNAFNEFEKNEGYFIISKIDALPYVLWDECSEESDDTDISDISEVSDLSDDTDISDISDISEVSDLSDASDLEDIVCYSNIFELLLDSCPIECYECVSNEIEQYLYCDIGSDCSECYSVSTIIPVAC
jgi:hypothetical protein